MQFRNHRIVGDILDLAARYCEEGADELVFYDITASPDGRSVDRTWVNKVAALLDIPFCVAGGIRSVADAEDVLNKGADKISVNSPALANPNLIDELARRFGAQCVVLGVDSREEGGAWNVYQYTGDPDKTQPAKRDTIAWVTEAESRGAGEVVHGSFDGLTDPSLFPQPQRGTVGPGERYPARPDRRAGTGF